LVSLFRAHLEYHAALDPRYEPASDARLTEFFHERLSEPDTLILLAEGPLDAQGYVLAQMRGSRRASSWVERLLLRVRPGQPFSFPSAVGYIADCFVAAEARRQGIGRQLVEQALEWCRRRGAIEVELGVLPNNPAGRAFWEALGFKPCRIEMRREL
jgi:GNAT superfamily N-acetyltransferase